MTASLPISRLISTSVNLTPGGAAAQNTSQLLILGSSATIDPTERYRVYNGLSEVATDFGTTAPEYLAALLWFEQLPQPTSLLIGRWVQSASPAYLRGGELPAADQLIATWNAITNGSLHVSVGGTVTSLTAMNFSGATNLNGVASIIQTALTGASVAATIVWNASFQRFELTSTATGAGATVGFVTAGTGGTDISALTCMTAALGAYTAQGAVAETALAAVTLFDSNYGQIWYAVTVLGSVDADTLAIAPYIEGSENRHFFGVTTQEAAVLNSTDTTSIPYLLNQAGYRHTATQYSSSNPYAVVSMLARILTTDYTANNSVITLMYKQEPGIVAENMNVSQISALEAKNCNVFVAYNNNTAIIEPGLCASGDFIDTVIGTDALALDIQSDVYNFLYTSPTKIPQTDAGNHSIVNVISARLSAYVNNGLLAPGIWNQTGFGTLATGDFLPNGYYVYAPPIASQNPTDRAARKSVTFQVAAKLAGAIHTVDILINVNR